MVLLIVRVPVPYVWIAIAPLSVEELFKFWSMGFPPIVILPIPVYRMDVVPKKLAGALERAKLKVPAVALLLLSILIVLKFPEVVLLTVWPPALGNKSTPWPATVALMRA